MDQDQRKQSIEILLNACKTLPQDEIKFLHDIINQFSETKSFTDKKVLINAHITTITLLVVVALLVAGADVEVIATHELCIHDKKMGKYDALTPLLEAKIPFWQLYNIPKDRYKEYYHLIFDCGAGTNKLLEPILGVLELTKTNGKDYEVIKKPVISVDISQSKEIETLLGTGDGLSRVLKAIMIYNLGSYNPTGFMLHYQDYFCKSYIKMLKDQNKKILVFGAGKVGQGIVNSLCKMGFKKMITVLDISFSNLFNINKLFNVKILNITNKEQVMDLVLTAENFFAVITATGIPNLISNYINSGLFKKNDFCNAYRINMGTPDEWGNLYDAEEILYNKKPVNFSLQYPTRPMFLDGVFSCWLLAGEYLIKDPEEKKNIIHPIPKNIDQYIIEKWTELYGQHTDSPGMQYDCATDLQRLNTLGFFKKEFSSNDEPLETLEKKTFVVLNNEQPRSLSLENISKLIC